VAAQPKRILIGFDGTPGARRALETAVELLGYGSSLTVVSVGRDGERHARAVLDDAHDLLLARLVTAEYMERIGDPAQELVAVASELDADLVVVGRRGGPEEQRVEPGSVSADVVRRAPCDVLVVG